MLLTRISRFARPTSQPHHTNVQIPQLATQRVTSARPRCDFRRSLSLVPQPILYGGGWRAIRGTSYARIQPLPAGHSDGRS